MSTYLKQLNLKDGKGVWSLLLLMLLIYLCTCFGPKTFKEGCLFDENIRSGQWWRLLTPGLLHDTFGHLLESACWLIFLGYQIEYYFGTKRFFVVIFLLILFSNCSQYYLHGGRFLGFSGVTVGIGSFLWRREVSYRETFCFPLFEKLILFAGNLFLWFVTIALTHEMFPSITAPVSKLVQMLSGPPCTNIGHFSHLGGGVVGWILGGLPFFRYRLRNQVSHVL